ncbi:MAG: PhnD/SsuA/transferrin family substrate-binding protein [Rhodobacteraceae bacterium]|nr:PhnD/SsuA/transferrin family substrate-binding protein [Paracoccaceae bacterium]
MSPGRRRFIAGAVAAAAAAPMRLRAAGTLRFALTPVFLDNDAAVIGRLRDALAEGTGMQIELVQRRTYEEITGALLEGSVDAAWLCGYPFLQHSHELELLGVPVWRGQPLYRSYLIVGRDDPAAGLADLRGSSHAFSDPNSNSGYLVTASDLIRMGEAPETFFSRTFFTYGHRNVVRAVAGGLARSGSVDGYVWEALAAVEPALTEATRIIARSEWLGFPPFAARAGGGEATAAIGRALRGFSGTESGRAALSLLFLDDVIAGSVALFDGIALRMADLARGP